MRGVRWSLVPGPFPASGPWLFLGRGTQSLVTGPFPREGVSLSGPRYGESGYPPARTRMRGLGRGYAAAVRLLRLLQILFSETFLGDNKNPATKIYLWWNLNIQPMECKSNALPTTLMEKYPVLSG